jgi:hypothetical protein
MDQASEAWGWYATRYMPFDAAVVSRLLREGMEMGWAVCIGV